MREALDLIRSDLGPNASVLHTREVSPGLLGWMTGSKRLEVIASGDADIPSQFPQPETASPKRPTADNSPSLNAPKPSSIRFEYNSTTNNSSVAADRIHRPTQTSIDGVGLEIKDEAHEDSDSKQIEDQFVTNDVKDALRNADFGEACVSRLIQKTCRSSSVKNQTAITMDDVMGELEQEIQMGEPIKLTPGVPHIVALVGPTGVGKTTTLAKLAAIHRVKKRLRVGLITVDTYRIAAVDQLQTYADIIDVPMQVVSTPKQMKLAITKMVDLDLILIDTAGRSPRDNIQIHELKSLLAIARPNEIQLVLSAVSSPKGFAIAMRGFGEVGVTSLLLTKLDEASGLGGIWPSLLKTALPISYLTDGQEVPNAIEVAQSNRLAAAAVATDTDRQVQMLTPIN